MKLILGFSTKQLLLCLEKIIHKSLLEGQILEWIWIMLNCNE